MMNQKSALYASEEKIKRAKVKADYITIILRRLDETHPISVRVEEHGGLKHVIARADQLPPADLAWETVEAVGHLRDALDKMMVELVHLNGRGTSGAQFPFGGINNGKPSSFPDLRIEKGIKKKLTAMQWDLVAAQKPYPGGNNTLWAVNEIANANKHRKGLVEVRPEIGHMWDLQPTSHSYYIGHLETNPRKYDFLLQDKERESVLLSTDGNLVNLNIESRVSRRISFGDITPVQGFNVVATLNKQIALVQRIIETFKKAFF